MNSVLSQSWTSGRTSSSSMERLTTKLQPVIDVFSSYDSSSFRSAIDAAEHLLFLRHTFIDDDQPRDAKDAFRQLRGFQTLVGFLSGVAELYDPAILGLEHRKSLFRVVTDVLGVLAEALKDHHVNKKYFANHFLGTGTTSLEEVLSKLSTKLKSHVGNDNVQDVEQLYGGLFAAALGQETLSGFFTTVRKKFDLAGEQPTPVAIKEAVSKTLGDTETVENSEFIASLVRLWLAQSCDHSSFAVQRLAIPACLNHLAIQSQRNRLALHSTGILSDLLRLMTESQRPSDEIGLYSDLASSLCTIGVNTLADAVLLFRCAHHSSDISKFLLQAIKSSKQPPFFQFDMSRNGYSSAELPNLGRPFPSASSSGYTLVLWTKFDAFDPNAHTTLFGVFDASQTCFLLIYLEKDTRNLILQTSIKGARPSVRFKSTVFGLGEWYHICIVHKKPRHASSSRAMLFINGEFVEQVKADYPSAPAIRSAQKLPRIQAFLGTPQDLAQKIGRGVSMSQWSCSSVVLFDEAFSDDVVSVFRHLGPRYHGNFQDSLGSFQTYRASAALNLRNENLHPGKEDTSAIVSMIRQKASLLVPESSVVLNLSPMAVLDNNDQKHVDESQLIKSLSKLAAKNLHNFTKGGNSVVINGAIPAINEALTRSNGVALLVGDPVVVVPQSLDDASWRIGGCPAVHLSIIEAASTAESLRIALEIMFESINDSWRNSEAMEKESGYGILAMLLREKLGFPSFQTSASKITPVCSTTQERNQLAMELLILILKFVGYDLESPKRSIIVNPLAYRVLLVDLDIWNYGDLPLLEIYYSQFRTLCVESHNHRFNARRLARMRVIKRLLETLKSGYFTLESLQLCIKAFQPLVTSCMAAEVLRSIALFITYAVHRIKDPNTLHSKKSLRLDWRPRRLTTSQLPDPSAAFLSKERIGVEILRIYADILCRHDDPMAIQKFAKTVTNKWLLYLISEENPEVVTLAARILARLLVILPSGYVRKFADKAGGFVILRHRLKRWWRLRPLWLICFAVLFGKDVALMDIEKAFDDNSLLRCFDPVDTIKVACPDMFPVISSMLQSGLKSALSNLPSEDGNVQYFGTQSTLSNSVWSMESESSMSGIDLLNSISYALTQFYVRSPGFRDFAASHPYIEELLSVLFPVVVGCDIANANVELDSDFAGLSVGSESVVIQPLSEPRQILHTTTVEQSGSERSLRRAGSFILVSSHKSEYAPSSARLRHVVKRKYDSTQVAPTNAAVQGVLNVVLAFVMDQLLSRKDFSGLSLVLKTPPGFVEHHTFFDSWLLRSVFSHVEEEISSNQTLLLEPRFLTNLHRFLVQAAEAVFEGWFVDGEMPTVDFIGYILEYLQKPEIACHKSVRLCSQAISGISSIFFRVVLLRLSESEESEALSFLRRLTYWQAVLLTAGDIHPEYLHLMSYLLYTKLVTQPEDVRIAASNLWRIILVQKPAEISAMLNNTSFSLQKRLVTGFQKLVGMDDADFLRWIDDQRDDLDCLFFGSLSKSWETFVRDENSKTEDSARSRLVQRKDRLKQWKHIETTNEEIVRRHDVTFGHWTSNIIASENLRSQRSIQDQHDDFAFLSAAFSRIYRALRQENGLLADGHDIKWRLDQTEGRSRMRLRIIPDDTPGNQDYRPKRKATAGIKQDASLRPVTPGKSTKVVQDILQPHISEGSTPDNESDSRSIVEDGFEMVDEPTGYEQGYEDKNRKVLRSLHRGEKVEHVCNVGRVIGLEVHEALLVLGKDYLYIMNNFFQRSDGEIVYAWQAPEEERDPYIRMITREETKLNNSEHETKSWKWTEVVSVSKRRFLLRDVGLEIFFADGRSYLLTLISPAMRDELHKHLSTQSPQIQRSSSSKTRLEDLSRFEALRSEDKTPHFFGSRFVSSVFSQTQYHPATRKWLKGELSNFHYLMVLNTLAGRTFNDLTQYPVFPWVIADYTSEELDLTNPKTFRDLSKPMGCQTPERVESAKERYQSIADMEGGRGFHYGTHYSSAMIVCWYLIRLQPFIKAYFSIQGDTFDHADRLFYSVAKAWESAAKSPGNTDVRELTPEFYYLPDFLVNVNKYNFGTRQNATQAIDAVELPPWAKGDPKIFIAKQREALESPYVTQNLHHWIDLIFGYKQTGEAAVEAVNVFHYLTYRGGTDLDKIQDPVQKTSDIQAIHQFGQTPHQIFTKPHPRRDESQHRPDRLDTAAESLALLPFPLLESQERVFSLLFSAKQDRLLCSAAFRLNIPPNYDKYMEWGFFDGSVRFYSSDTKKLIGHFEHVHIGQLSCAVFADSQTLITSGTDCTISVWTYSYNAQTKSVDLVPKASLLGHQTPVTVLAVSRSFSTVLSASKDGKIMLWDLNRLEFVRELPSVDGPVDCARINDATGNIAICVKGRVSIYTLNGALLVDQAVCERNSDSILSCAFYEGPNNEWLRRELFFTGHRRGLVNIWNITIQNGNYELELIRQLHHVEGGRGDGAGAPAGISCILPQHQVIYTGDEAGRVYEWDCVLRR
ncbi:hypothetical protein VTO42DRAFT_3993 [Malbranchea cinnamomea]